MIVGLGHQARVGKDTLARHLVEAHGFRQAAFADKLRELALAIDPYFPAYELNYSTMIEAFTYERCKDEYPDFRRFLENLGEKVRHVLGEDVWVRAVMDTIRPGEDVVISDVRYPNEVAAVRAAGGFYVKVIRDIQSPTNHVSQTALLDVAPDAWVYNTGTVDDLQGEGDMLVAMLTEHGVVIHGGR